MLDRLTKMVESYAKVKPKHFVGDVNLRVGEQAFTIHMAEDQVTVSEGAASDPLLELLTDEAAWSKLSLGIWNGLTAAGRENMRQSAPLDFKLPDGVPFEERKELLLHLAMHFFKQRYPHAYRFGPNHARTVHGGQAVALVYAPGVRYAYYALGPGQQANEDDDTNPFDQFLTVMSGRGVAVIDGVEMALEPGVAVHVPVDKTHVIKADGSTGLEFFWLAYGPGA